MARIADRLRPIVQCGNHLAGPHVRRSRTDCTVRANERPSEDMRTGHSAMLTKAFTYAMIGAFSCGLIATIVGSADVLTSVR